MIVLILIIIAEALLTSLLPYSKGEFYSSLETKVLIVTYLVYFFINSFGIDLVQSVKGYCVTRFALKKRAEHTDYLVKKEIKRKRDIDNVPQRIQEDIKLMYTNRYLVTVEYFISGLILVGIVVFNLNHYWLIGSALLYACITIGIAYLFNGKLIGAEKQVQKTEANFRKNHLVMDVFGLANKASLLAAKINLHFTVFTKLQNAIVLVLPFILLLPGYLSGSIEFGDLIKIATMFQLIVCNANVLISLFPKLVIGKASKERVEEL